MLTLSFSATKISANFYASGRRRNMEYLKHVHLHLCINLVRDNVQRVTNTAI